MSSDSQLESTVVISESQSEISNSDTVSEMEYFEECPINKKDNIEAYSKLTENQIINPEIKEIKSVQKDNKLLNL